MAYITQFYSWSTGNTITAARLNGNVTNIVDALSGGTKDVNVLTLEIGGTTVIDNSENFISTGKYNLNADGTAIDATGAITFGAAQDAGIYWDGSSVVLQQTTALTNTVSYNKLSHITSGTPAAGIGVGIQLEAETAAGNNEIGVVLDAVTTDVTSTSEDFDFVIKCMAAGATASEVGRFQSDGKLDLVSGAEYQINGTDVLSSTTLGSGVVNSSLTSVGTLTGLTVTAQGTFTGGAVMSGSLNLGAAPILTISSGAVTKSASYHRIDTEGAASSDNLDTINGGTTGDLLILTAANSSRTVVVRDDGSGGNIALDGNVDFSLDHIADTITLLYITLGVWVEISRSTNA